MTSEEEQRGDELPLPRPVLYALYVFFAIVLIAVFAIVAAYA